MPTALTIGNYDGVHLGHRAILARCHAIADARGARVLAVTFDPPPVAILRAEAVPPALCSIDDRVAELRGAGADEVRVLEPTRELLSQTPEQFVAGLVREHAPVAIIEGPDFHFGKGRAGDVAALRTLGASHGFDVHVVEEVTAKLTHGVSAPVRSTLVRTLVGQGRLLDAAACLDRPFSIVADAVKGEQRGRTIGVPTVNLDPATWQRLIVPPDGVYAGHAHLAGESTPRPAAISLGPKPTFAGTALTLEAHILDYEPSDPDALYGQSVRLTFARWVRDQYPFPSVGVLVDQLRRDVDRVRRWHDAGLLNLPRIAA